MSANSKFIASRLFKTLLRFDGDQGLLDRKVFETLLKFQYYHDIDLNRRLFLDKVPNEKLIVSALPLSSLEKSKVKLLYSQQSLKPLNNHVVPPPLGKSRRPTSVKQLIQKRIDQVLKFNSFNSKAELIKPLDNLMLLSLLQLGSSLESADRQSKELGSGSIVLIFKDETQSITKVHWKRLQNELNDKFNGVSTPYPSLVPSDKQFVNFEKIDEISFILALRSSILSVPVNYKTLESHHEYEDSIAANNMYMEFSTSFQSCGKKIKDWKNEEEDLTINVDLLKALLKQYFMVNLTYDTEGEIDQETLVKKFKDLFTILNSYDLVFALLNYSLIPYFSSNIIETLGEKSKKQTYGYDYFMSLAQKSKENQKESLFEAILEELAKNSLTTIEKSKSKDVLYFTRNVKLCS